ncbi:hypothetical protein DRW48_03365 [Paracoccus suum]|uniref:Uncharacterized protein n=1 Tax=Paracoccus suum TaxID=2259340 RepID=A0A344PHK4_9RHOB|nr:hypothetical protein [Paracoccus suum]AXC48859.1 hypothetical protein DRW48_03365 [Paracoccus suum]
MPIDVTAFFIVQPGSLSLRARFLVASLREQTSDALPLHAFLPRGRGQLDDATIAFLRDMNVEIREFEPQIWDRHSYAIGNKVDAARQGFDSRFAIFLDTDILAVGRPEFWRLTGHWTAATTNFGGQEFDSDQLMKLGKEALKLGSPMTDSIDDDRALEAAQRIRSFNSGVVWFDVNGGFPEEWWRATSAVLESDLPDSAKRPFADQTALMLISAQAEDRIGVLDWRWNRLIKGWRPDRRDVFVHYFRFPSLFLRPELCRRIVDLHRRHAENGHNLLGELTVRDLYEFQNGAVRPGRERLPVLPTAAELAEPDEPNPRNEEANEVGGAGGRTRPPPDDAVSRKARPRVSRKSNAARPVQS